MSNRVSSSGDAQASNSETKCLESTAQASNSEAKGLEGTGLSLPVNFYGNLRSAQSDQHLKDLLHQAKEAEQTAVVTYGAKWCHACRQMLPTFCNLKGERKWTNFMALALRDYVIESGCSRDWLRKALFGLALSWHRSSNDLHPSFTLIFTWYNMMSKFAREFQDNRPR